MSSSLVAAKQIKWVYHYYFFSKAQKLIQRCEKYLGMIRLVGGNLARRK
jgi:hypothetical protein